MKPEANKVATFSQILLWFGAAVSIAEILTGALLAPLGLRNGILSIIVGHIIGGVILFLAGIIGAQSGLSAARSVRISFGKYGSFGFSILNLLQLLGWTAIMIINAAKSLDGITGQLLSYQNEKLWCIVIGLLICLWVVIGIKNLSKLNTIVISALFVFSLILGYTVFKQKITSITSSEIMSFGAAVELNVVMCLSWLPLISDYTMRLEKPISGTIGSVLGYFVGGILMFTIGLGAAIYAGTSDISTILLTAGLGAIALFIVVLSTVTTTFLDVYSAGVSIVNLNDKINEKIAAIIVCIMGTLLAIFVSMSQYENFLYLIGSVFAPLFSILFVDYFILGKKEIGLQKILNIKNVLLWCVGFVGYRLLMEYDTPVGITLPVMVVIGALYFFICKGSERKDGN
ncbi:MAG: putative hydroxymethylpyrimidine transporter CytX [Fusobacteriaceae bacterium]|jgi:putative hydroxymethylpyrimidine transporter CytX|nr:putative hydroxymethylpyrimidine transporter CytX [Fusobacteriaceae bacterium]